MIDFRYHLVSLISIFLALAVGIVLGAGPLQANIGTQLTDQVSALRTEKQDLNDRLTASDKRVDAGEEYSAAVTERVVAGRLSGHDLVVLALPSADSTLVQQLEAAVAASGATRSTTLTLTADWFDSSQAADRAVAAKEAAAVLGLSSAATGDDLLREVLTRLAVGIDHVEASEPRTEAVAVLADAGLLDSSADEFGSADLAIVVSGDFAGTEEVVKGRSDSVTALARGLAEGTTAAVVAGPGPVIATGQPVSSDAVDAIRDDSATANVISTVDHARDGAGPALVVLALEAELDEDVGHYGTATGATSLLPRIAP